MMRGCAVVLAVLLAGCSGHANVQANSSNVSSGGSVNIPRRSTVSTLLSIVFLVGVSYEGERGMPQPVRVPEMDPSRRVLEHDCSKPIEDWSANLKCK